MGVQVSPCPLLLLLILRLHHGHVVQGMAYVDDRFNLDLYPDRHCSHILFLHRKLVLWPDQYPDSHGQPVSGQGQPSTLSTGQVVDKL